MQFEALAPNLVYLLAFLIILVESGIFFLFFLPGDSLLFALGILAAGGKIALGPLILILIASAIIGNILGYFLGTLMRRGLLEGRRYLPKVNPEHLARAETFYDRYGVYAVLFARFVPVVRTIVPFFAGIVMMHRRTFTLWTIIGGIFWISTVVLVGYYLGEEFNLHDFTYIGVGVILIAAIATPVFLKLLKRLA